MLAILFIGVGGCCLCAGVAECRYKRRQVSSVHTQSDKQGKLRQWEGEVGGEGVANWRYVDMYIYVCIGD